MNTSCKSFIFCIYLNIFFFLFTGLQCVTSVQYVLLYDAIQDSGKPIYQTMEEIVRFANPAFCLPSK